jgi:hypoxia up-regulated 1
MLLLWVLIVQVWTTVIGIDYGTDWIKVSVIKPGGKIETVLNRESKRKTNNVINIRNGIRTYGIEASNLGTRFPEGTFPNLKHLVGKLVSDPIVEEYQSLNSNVLAKSSRNTVQFEHEGKTYLVEELVAMLLAHAKKQAESYASIQVSGAVITVPPHFTIFERQAILDAADIANLRVYALIHDETAVAINFAVGKQFNKKEYHIFYDMGAGTTVATLASFQSGQDKKQNVKNLVDLEIKGHSVEELGGQMIDLRLQKHLADDFMNQHSKRLDGSIFDNPKAMARLLKEANRCKSILSANQNVMSSVENLMQGVDFKTTVSRKTLEDLNADLFEKVTKPIEQVLQKANITLDHVKSLVLFGGGVRVPAIQNKLREYVGESKIARNVDGDEAAVFGAVLHAARVSASFRLGQTVRVKDLNPKPIQVLYETEKKGKYLTTVLFTPESHLGSRKLMTFKRVSDFDIQVAYRGDESIPIVTVKVKGLSEAMEKYKEKALSEPKVKVQIGLTDSGMLQFTDASVTFEIPAEAKDNKPDSIKDSVLNFFGGKKKEGGEDPKDEEKEKKTEEKHQEETPEEKEDPTVRMVLAFDLAQRKGRFQQGGS